MSRTSSTFKKNQTVLQSINDSAYLTSVPRTRSPSPLRKSSSLTKSIRESRELSSIENEYINNLQKQVYYLELEANYLREQAKRATDMHPKMTAEAERMLGKLRGLQTDADILNLELKKKDANLEAIYSEKDRVLNRLEEEEDHKRKLHNELEEMILLRQREKRQLSDEIATLRKERDMLSLENNRRHNEIRHVSTDKETLQLQLRDAEDTIARLRDQLDIANEERQDLRLTVDTKKSQLLDAESHARSVEDRYVRNTAIEHDRTVSKLRDEIISLRSQLKNAELSADEERLMRSRAQEDSGDVIAEYTELKHQVNDLKKALNRERELRETTDEKRSRNLMDLSRVSDNERELQMEVRRLEDLLLDEKEKNSRLLKKMGKTESLNASLEYTSASARDFASEVDSKYRFMENENKQLRRDKDVLIEHVAELQRQNSRKEGELKFNRSTIRDMKGSLEDLTDIHLSTSTNSKSWRELEHLTDNMKSLTRSMQRSISPKSPRGSMRRSRSRTRFADKL